jgi:quercetin dioxygenase-like cupin family protein
MKRFILSALLSTALVPAAFAQATIPADNSRKVVETIEMPNGYNVVTSFVTLAKGVCSDRHTHPGFESSTVVSGEITYEIAGREKKTFKAGDHFGLNQYGAVHQACTPNSDAKLFVVHIVEKGKPLSTSVSTADGAKAMLAKAIAAVKANRELALIQFVKGEAGFLDGDLYPFCANISDGKTLASPRAVPAGTDVRSLKDGTGKKYGEEIYAAGQKAEGEVTEVKGYDFPKPGTLSPNFPKTSYVTKVGELVCGVGYYD